MRAQSFERRAELPSFQRVFDEAAQEGGGGMMAQRVAEIESRGNAEALKNTANQRKERSLILQGHADFPERHTLLVHSEDAARNFVGLAFHGLCFERDTLGATRRGRQQLVFSPKLQGETPNLIVGGRIGESKSEIALRSQRGMNSVSSGLRLTNPSIHTRILPALAAAARMSSGVKRSRAREEWRLPRSRFRETLSVGLQTLDHPGELFRPGARIFEKRNSVEDGIDHAARFRDFGECGGLAAPEDVANNGAAQTGGRRCNLRRELFDKPVKRDHGRRRKDCPIPRELMLEVAHQRGGGHDDAQTGFAGAERIAELAENERGFTGAGRSADQPHSAPPGQILRANKRGNRRTFTE